MNNSVTDLVWVLEGPSVDAVVGGVELTLDEPRVVAIVE